MPARLLPVALAAAYAAVAVLQWSQPEWRPEWDSATYLLTARSLAAGEGYRYQGEPFFLRPPGFAFALALGMEGGEIDPAAQNRWIALSAALALLTAALALGPALGRPHALAAALLAATAPVFLTYLNWVLSDLPFVALLFGALRLLDPRDVPPRRAWLHAGVGALLLAGAAWLRSVALLILPGLVLLALLRPEARRRSLAAALVAGLLVAPWLLHARELASAAPRPSEQLLLFDYWTALLRSDPGDPDAALLGPGAWAARIAANGAGLRRDLALTTLGTPSIAASTALFGLVALGFGARARRGFALLEWHALAYGALLLTYFSYDPRLALPLLPLLYGYGLLGAATAGGWIARHARGGAARALPRLLPALLAVGLGAHNLAALPASLDPGRLSVAGAGTLAELWARERLTASWLRRHTPPDAVVLARNAPVLALLAERRVHTYRFQRRPGIAERTGADYAVFDLGPPGPLERSLSARAARRVELPAPGPGPAVRIYALRGSPAGRERRRSTRPPARPTLALGRAARRGRPDDEETP